jgi:hypothetical protein
MLPPPVSVKRFTLPFSTDKKDRQTAETEAAAVYAIAEFERSKGGGLIVRQPEEKLIFIAKMGYPLWLYPKNDSVYIFDGLNPSDYAVQYFEMPQVSAFKDSLEKSSRTREDYTSFLSTYDGYFKQPPKEKQFRPNGLIADADFKKEFSQYRREASEITNQPMTTIVPFSPIIGEAAISPILTDLENLQISLKMDVEKLQACLRFMSKTTNQYITEMDYAAQAVKDEANAKIRAQKEIIDPKIAKLNKEYKRRITELTRHYNEEIERLKKLKSKTEKSKESIEVKIKQYQNQAEKQASIGHLAYEKSWKTKSNLAKKEINALKKELKSLENNIKNLAKQKIVETSKLQAALDSEVKFARQPLLALEVTRDAKMLAFKREAQKLISQEKFVADGINSAITLRETVNAKFETLGMREPQLKTQAIFYIPFYAVCYRAGAAVERCVFLSPSTISPIGFRVKLKGVLGMPKIKELFISRFKTIASLIGKAELRGKQDASLNYQVVDLGQKNNLLNVAVFRENVARGLVYLKNEGCFSEKEFQVLSGGLASF